MKERKMKNVIKVIAVLACIGFSQESHAIRVYDVNSLELGNFTDIKCADGVDCTVVGGRANMAFGVGNGTLGLSGYLQRRTSVSGDLTAAQCGYTVSNDGIGGSANGPVDLFNLPLISSAILGCRFTFMVGTEPTANQQLQVNPQTADKILILASAKGDAISNDKIGTSVVLEATQTGWFPVGKEQGTWFDIN